jgi:hypothetical protein
MTRPTHSPTFHFYVVRATVISFLVALIFGTLELLPAVTAIPLVLYLAGVIGLQVWAAVLLAAAAAALLRGAINIILDLIVRPPGPLPVPGYDVELEVLPARGRVMLRALWRLLWRLPAALVLFLGFLVGAIIAAPLFAGVMLASVLEEHVP